MKYRIWLISVLMLLAPGAYGISYSFNANGAGCSATLGVPTDQELVAVTAMDGGSISNAFSGKGNLHENHFVTNGAGVTAFVRADLINAENYTYSYELIPNPNAARNAEVVQASESLDAEGATYIKAAATAASPGLLSSASTEVIFGSLKGYSCVAVAGAGRASASQNLDEASGTTQTYSSTDYITHPTSDSKGDGAQQSAHVATSVQGDITNYGNSAVSWSVGSEIKETSHIIGSFWSDATAGSQTKVRTSDFGTEFDLSRYAPLGKSAGGLRGITKDSTGYHVSPGDKIQDAINVASSGDRIDVKPGTYVENLNIGKSLIIAGNSFDNTIIDGGQRGSVISMTTQISCTLINLRIQNGSAENGGGIYNLKGTLTLNNCVISGNKAVGSGYRGGWGGGIVNGGILNLNGVTVSGNSALVNHGGGGISNSGILNIDGATISGNNGLLGGGILNENWGRVNMSSGTISGNTAIWGGGIYNNFGILNLNGGTISDNNARDYGGGIYNRVGTVNLNGGAISGNQAGTYGGGIFNSRGIPTVHENTVWLNDGTISGNRASKGGGIYDECSLIRSWKKPWPYLVFGNSPDEIFPIYAVTRYQ